MAIQPRYASNDLAVVKSMVQSGNAIGPLPYSDVYQDIKSHQLESILPEWQEPHWVAYSVWPARHSLSIRAKTFSTQLNEYLRAQPWFVVDE